MPGPGTKYRSNTWVGEISGVPQFDVSRQPGSSVGAYRSELSVAHSRVLFILDRQVQHREQPEQYLFEMDV